MVLRDSRLVKIETAGKDMSFEDTLIALSPLLPHVSANITKTYNQYVPEMIFGRTAVPMGDKNPLGAGVDIYQTICDFGRASLTIKRLPQRFTPAKRRWRA